MMLFNEKASQIKIVYGDSDYMENNLCKKDLGYFLTFVFQPSL